MSLPDAPKLDRELVPFTNSWRCSERQLQGVKCDSLEIGESCTVSSFCKNSFGEEGGSKSINGNVLWVAQSERNSSGMYKR